jgi:hypothetical protein
VYGINAIWCAFSSIIGRLYYNLCLFHGADRVVSKKSIRVIAGLECEYVEGLPFLNKLIRKSGHDYDKKLEYTY